jgi:hypothetical protein
MFFWTLRRRRSAPRILAAAHCSTLDQPVRAEVAVSVRVASIGAIGTTIVVARACCGQQPD